MQQVDVSIEDFSTSEDEQSILELMDDSSDSDDDEEDDNDVYRSDGGYDMDTVTRALCVDSCELHRGF